MTNTRFHPQPLTLPEHPETAKQVEAMLQRVADYDGIAAFSEQFLNGLHDARLGHNHLVVNQGDDVVGVVGFAPDGSAELAVDPQSRGQGMGRSLVDATFAHNPAAGLWAHGNLPDAHEVALLLGLRPVRELLVMRLDEVRAEPVQLPEGYEAFNLTEASAKWGRGALEKAWLEANNQAFSWHPEQGGWDTERLHRAMEAEWFDPAGVWLLYRGEELAGFHWTKRHPDGTGEVYVVGLADAFRGHGLGGVLMELGLVHLAEQGSPAVILYVEADNAPAVKRYEELGFQVAERHVVYKAAGAAAGD